MSEYINHTWKDGETIDAAKMNNIETGIVEAKKEAEKVTIVAETAQKAETAAGEAKQAAEEAQESVKTLEDNKLTAPAPGSADNGRFLRVVNGQPAWVTIQNAEGESF